MISLDSVLQWSQACTAEPRAKAGDWGLETRTQRDRASTWEISGRLTLAPEIEAEEFNGEEMQEPALSSATLGSV